jgi:hypothetical protein
MLTFILSLIVAVQIIMAILVIDLCNRAKKMVVLYEEARRVVNKIHHALATGE